jgi:hypothetical protein
MLCTDLPSPCDLPPPSPFPPRPKKVQGRVGADEAGLIAIEDCARPRCPARWTNLSPYPQVGQAAPARSCHECKHQVLKCRTTEQMELATKFGWVDQHANASFNRRRDSTAAIAYCTANTPSPHEDWTFAPWFMGGIKRDIALFLLEPQDLGCFLVRENVSSPGDFVMSIRGTASVEHIRVVKVRASIALRPLPRSGRKIRRPKWGACVCLIPPLPSSSSCPRLSLSSCHAPASTHAHAHAHARNTHMHALTLFSSSPVPCIGAGRVRVARRPNGICNSAEPG